MSRIRLIMYNIFVLNLSGDINIINFFYIFNFMENESCVLLRTDRVQ